MKIGIVGAEAAKFTPLGEQRAKALINDIICDAADISVGEPLIPKIYSVGVVSGACHLGCIDIWAMEGARCLFIPPERLHEYPPKELNWSKGFQPRNVQIAHASDFVHNIVVAQYPKEYNGMRFAGCYHC